MENQSQYKIKKMRLKNFAKFTDFEIEFDNKLTRLVGMNGNGKTTVGLTALWAGLKGISEKKTGDQLIGQRFRFIGDHGSNAKIGIILQDTTTGAEIQVRNTISKEGNAITFESSQGNLDDNWLKELFNASFLSAKNFSQLSGKEQATTLGLDVSEYDDRIKELKAEATILNRNIKAFGNLIEVVKPRDEEDAQELVIKRDKLKAEHTKSQLNVTETNEKIKVENEKIIKDAKDSNEKHTNLTLKYNRCNDALSILESEGYIPVDAANFLEEIKKSIPAFILDFKTKELVPVSTSTPEIDELSKKIEQLLTTQSEQKVLYDEYLRKRTELDKLINDAAEVKKKIEVETQNRLECIKNSKFKINGLDIDDEGNLTYKGKLIREPYFSKSELEMLVASLYAVSNPQLKVRFIDEFQSIDEINQEKILDFLFKKDFQVITAEVGDHAVKPNSLVLRECKLVGADGNTEEAEEGVI